MYSDDPVRDYSRYDAERQAAEDELPHCDYCGEAIYEHYYLINDEIVCEECLCENFRKEVDEYGE